MILGIPDQPDVVMTEALGQAATAEQGETLVEAGKVELVGTPSLSEATEAVGTLVDEEKAD